MAHFGHYAQGDPPLCGRCTIGSRRLLRSYLAIEGSGARERILCDIEYFDETGALEKIPLLLAVLELVEDPSCQACAQAPILQDHAHMQDKEDEDENKLSLGNGSARLSDNQS